MESPPTKSATDSPPDHNVYAPPESQAQVPMRSEYYVEGEFIVCRNPTVLPRRCIKTNQEDEAIKRTTCKFTWTHQAVFVSVLLSPLLLLILYLALSKKCEIAYGINPKQSRLLKTYNMLGIFTILGGGLIGIFGISTLSAFDWPAISIGITLIGLAVFFTGCVLNHKSAPLRIMKVWNGWFYLKGASREYLAQISEDQANARLEQIL